MGNVIFGESKFAELNLGQAIMCLKYLASEYKNGDEEIMEDIIKVIDLIEEPVLIDTQEQAEA